MNRLPYFGSSIRCSSRAFSAVSRAMRAVKGPGPARYSVGWKPRRAASA
jgi:hypothetical protein